MHIVAAAQFLQCFRITHKTTLPLQPASSPVFLVNVDHSCDSDAWHSMCKQKEQAPYSFVLYKDGQPHTLTTRESCTSNGVETVSLPAKNFPDATSLSIINIGNTDLVVSVYEVKEPHHE